MYRAHSWNVVASFIWVERVCVDGRQQNRHKHKPPEKKWLPVVLHPKIRHKINQPLTLCVDNKPGQGVLVKKPGKRQLFFAIPDDGAAVQRAITQNTAAVRGGDRPLLVHPQQDTVNDVACGRRATHVACGWASSRDNGSS